MNKWPGGSFCHILEIPNLGQISRLSDKVTFFTVFAGPRQNCGSGSSVVWTNNRAC